MSESKINRPSLARDIYRFELNGGNVPANGSPTMTRAYAYNNDFTLSSDSKKIICHNAGTLLVSVHVAGQSGSDNRLWCKVKGGNIEPQILSAGAYVSGESVQVVAVANNSQIWLEFVNAFNINSGGVSPSTIFITKLD